jgi:hypothetical protein
MPAIRAGSKATRSLPACGASRSGALEPFEGYELLRALPAYVGSPLLFWHSAGESCKELRQPVRRHRAPHRQGGGRRRDRLPAVPVPRLAALARRALAQGRALDLVA